MADLKNLGHVRDPILTVQPRHLYLAGRPSRWELAHILVYC